MSQRRTDAFSRPARARGAIAFAVALLVLPAVTGCTTAEIDRIPKEYGGLPEGAPRRSDNPPPYPAVHDMPPARSRALMDQDQQKRLEEDLVAARTRLQNQQKNQAKAAPKQAAARPAEKPANRPTVKRGRRPTALADEGPGGSGQGARPAPLAPANPPAGDNAPAWPAPPAPNPR